MAVARQRNTKFVSEFLRASSSCTAHLQYQFSDMHHNVRFHFNFSGVKKLVKWGGIEFWKKGMTNLKILGKLQPLGGIFKCDSKL